LAVRGVVEIVEPELSEAERAELDARILHRDSPDSPRFGCDPLPISSL
jgi:hypothetical protein